MEEYYPSEIARLVLGYLEEVKCKNSWNTFLEESTDLQEYHRLYKMGRTYSTNVRGDSLLDILTAYSAVKSFYRNTVCQNTCKVILNDFTYLKDHYQLHKQNTYYATEKTTHPIVSVLKEWILKSNEDIRCSDFSADSGISKSHSANCNNDNNNQNMLYELNKLDKKSNEECTDKTQNFLNIGESNIQIKANSQIGNLSSKIPVSQKGILNDSIVHSKSSDVSVQNFVNDSVSNEMKTRNKSPELRNDIARPYLDSMQLDFPNTENASHNHEIVSNVEKSIETESDDLIMEKSIDNAKSNGKSTTESQKTINTESDILIIYSSIKNTQSIEEDALSCATLCQNFTQNTCNKSLEPRNEIARPHHVNMQFDFPHTENPTHNHETVSCVEKTIKTESDVLIMENSIKNTESIQEASLCGNFSNLKITAECQNFTKNSVHVEGNKKFNVEFSGNFTEGLSSPDLVYQATENSATESSIIKMIDENKIANSGAETQTKGICQNSIDCLKEVGYLEENQNACVDRNQHFIAQTQKSVNDIAFSQTQSQLSVIASETSETSTVLPFYTVSSYLVPKLSADNDVQNNVQYRIILNNPVGVNAPVTSGLPFVPSLPISSANNQRLLAPSPAIVLTNVMDMDTIAHPKNSRSACLQTKEVAKKKDSKRKAVLFNDESADLSVSDKKNKSSEDNSEKHSHDVNNELPKENKKFPNREKKLQVNIEVPINDRNNDYRDNNNVESSDQKHILLDNNEMVVCKETDKLQSDNKEVAKEKDTKQYNSVLLSLLFNDELLVSDKKNESSKDNSEKHSHEANNELHKENKKCPSREKKLQVNIKMPVNDRNNESLKDNNIVENSDQKYISLDNKKVVFKETDKLQSDIKGVAKRKDSKQRALLFNDKSTKLLVSDKKNKSSQDNREKHSHDANNELYKENKKCPNREKKLQVNIEVPVNDRNCEPHKDNNIVESSDQKYISLDNNEKVVFKETDKLQSDIKEVAKKNDSKQRALLFNDKSTELLVSDKKNKSSKDTSEKHSHDANNELQKENKKCPNREKKLQVNFKVPVNDRNSEPHKDNNNIILSSSDQKYLLLDNNEKVDFKETDKLQNGNKDVAMKKDSKQKALLFSDKSTELLVSDKKNKSSKDNSEKHSHDTNNELHKENKKLPNREKNLQVNIEVLVNDRNSELHKVNNNVESSDQKYLSLDNNKMVVCKETDKLQSGNKEVKNKKYALRSCDASFNNQKKKTQKESNTGLSSGEKNKLPEINKKRSSQSKKSVGRNAKILKLGEVYEDGNIKSSFSSCETLKTYSRRSCLRRKLSTSAKNSSSIDQQSSNNMVSVSNYVSSNNAMDRTGKASLHSVTENDCSLKEQKESTLLPHASSCDLIETPILLKQNDATNLDNSKLLNVPQRKNPFIQTETITSNLKQNWLGNLNKDLLFVCCNEFIKERNIPDKSENITSNASHKYFVDEHIFHRKRKCNENCSAIEKSPKKNAVSSPLATKARKCHKKSVIKICSCSDEQ